MRYGSLDLWFQNGGFSRVEFEAPAATLVEACSTNDVFSQWWREGRKGNHCNTYWSSEHNLITELLLLLSWQNLLDSVILPQMNSNIRVILGPLIASLNHIRDHSNHLVTSKCGEIADYVNEKTAIISMSICQLHNAITAKEACALCEAARQPHWNTKILRQIVPALKSSTWTLDPILASFWRNISHLVSEVVDLTQQSIYLKSFKTALVKSLLKKKSLEPLITYRQISNHPFFSFC